MTPPMMKFSFIFELLSAGIGLNMDGVVVISILLELPCIPEKLSQDVGHP